MEEAVELAEVRKIYDIVGALVLLDSLFETGEGDETHVVLAHTDNVEGKERVNLVLLSCF